MAKQGRTFVSITQLVVAFLVAAAGAAGAAASTINDRAGLFSESARAAGNRILEQIHQQTEPRKDVVVETFEGLPPGVGSAADLAKRVFRERSVDGVLIAVVKNPRRLEVVVGRKTEQRFDAADRNDLVEVLRARFRNNDFDQGLLEGLQLAQRKLVAAFPASHAEADAATRVEREPRELGRSAEESSSGLPTWLWIVLAVGGVWLLLAVLRSATQPSMPSAASSGTPAGYGGGWGQSILGGLFGAMAGSWIYDRLSGRGESEAYGGHGETHDSDPGRSSWSDDGEAGGSSGADFGGGGDDFGGGDAGGGDY